MARSLLIGGVLLIAQLGAHELRSLLSTGQKEVLKGVRRDARGNAGQLCEKLAKASPLEILDFIK